MAKAKRPKSLGSNPLDLDIYTRSLEGELLTMEECEKEIAEYEAEYGKIEPPQIKPDKFSYFSFIKDGKPHEKADEILLWVIKMCREGREDELPETAEEIMEMFDK